MSVGARCGYRHHLTDCGTDCSCDSGTDCGTYCSCDSGTGDGGTDYRPDCSCDNGTDYGTDCSCDSGTDYRPDPGWLEPLLRRVSRRSCRGLHLWLCGLHLTGRVATLDRIGMFDFKDFQ
jgi:hypothetical protein